MKRIIMLCICILYVIGAYILVLIEILKSNQSSLEKILIIFLFTLIMIILNLFMSEMNKKN